MEDQELQEIRARRMQQLQHQQKNGPATGANPQDQQELKQKQEEAKVKEDEFRNAILSQVLTQDARTRLNIIKTAKPDKGRMVEDILINNARMGMFPGRISEDEFKKILEQVNSRFAPKETKVTFDRRRVNLDSDDDDLDFE